MKTPISQKTINTRKTILPFCAGEHHAYTWAPRNSCLIHQREEFKKSITYAVVTGANKGIGLEVCRQLATQGVTVVLTARDEKRGLEAVEKLKASSLSGSVIFHQLDVADLASIASLAEFIKSQFGKLDILVNNAGIGGVTVDSDGIRAIAGATSETGAGIVWNEVVSQTSQTYDSAAECFQTNYYGAKRTAEALLPLLQLSDSPRIVNVSSTLGKLKVFYLSNSYMFLAKFYETILVFARAIEKVLNDAENLTEERIDQVLNEFLKDFKEGSQEAKGWPKYFGAYIVSKAALNAYTRILAKKYPSFRINSVCPGYVKTDINFNTGYLTVEEGGESLVRLALLPDDGPSGFSATVASLAEFIKSQFGKLDILFTYVQRKHNAVAHCLVKCAAWLLEGVDDLPSSALAIVISE
ncbi:(+)-neomenthol dehydrogenase [Sesamum angolense]|uniref:(+)-neomenthol dehydrogenase n=1 Tax=Sesamum angolense TaxID=2727404 RepID=A0AAE1XGG1_9LAMI|nr:(+)-neomenthol dehydrogenase [Sesamum angolense]